MKSGRIANGVGSLENGNGVVTSSGILEEHSRKPKSEKYGTNRVSG